MIGGPIAGVMLIWATSLPAQHSAKTNVVPNRCNGLSAASSTAVVMGGSGAYTYRWSTSPQQFTETATALLGGTYLVVVTDLVSGGQVPAFAIVIDPPPLLVSLTNTPTRCFGQCSGSASASVTGGTPGYSYLWSTGATTATLAEQCAGQVSVSVTDAQGCGLTYATTVTQPPAIVATHLYPERQFAADLRRRDRTICNRWDSAFWQGVVGLPGHASWCLPG